MPQNRTHPPILRAPYRRPGRGAGRSRRWTLWARALRRRLRPQTRRGGAAAMILRLGPSLPPGPAVRGVERVIERGPLCFSPRLQLSVHLPHLRPQITLAGRIGAAPPSRIGRTAVIAARAVSGAQTPAASRPPASRPPESARGRQAGSPGGAPPDAAIYRGPDAVLGTPTPMERACRRTRRSAGAPPASAPLAGDPPPVLRSGVRMWEEHRDLARQVARRTRRVEQRSLALPGRYLQRPPAPQPSTLREAPAAAAAPAPPWPAGGPWGRPPAREPQVDVRALTDQVMRQIDRRLVAWRERTGRV
jgi:hypothetical protein